MTDTDFRPGLEGVIAFESEIAEPDKEGGALRYRGVNINDLLVSQPDTGEQALEITDMLVRSSAVDVVVVDSVAALGRWLDRVAAIVPK